MRVPVTLLFLGCLVLGGGPASAQTGTAAGAGLSGFSVALIEGTLQADPQRPAAPVPAVWAKALNDMKDFLPYSQYRLLDSQWILGSGRLAVQLAGATGDRYSLNMQTAFPYYLSHVAGGAQGAVGTVPRVSVSQFVLSSGASGDLMGQLMSNQEQTRVRHEIGRASNLDLQRAEQQVEHARASRFAPFRPLIDTSFTMDIGETVVVGTSRVNGDRAIIVLLTAVAKR